jgi:proline dehydrogenase
MLRSLLIYLSHADWARNMVMHWAFAWRAASRFIAGEKLEDGIAVIQKLNEKGINATLDHLGEHTTNPDEARRAAQDIIDAVDAIDKSGARSNVSIKLTQIGLALGEDLAAENLKRILECAQEARTFVRIDIEDSPWVDKTLALYRRMRYDYGLENVGVAIQSYLYRSEQDVLRLRDECTHVRLCKGAYKEPPDIAFPKKQDVDASYDHLAHLLMDGALQFGCQQLSEDGRIPPTPALATHDEKRILNAKAYAQQIGLPKKALEFQMLNGIRRDLQDSLAGEGYPVRVYVPYGRQWYPYFVRRLAERPANVWFFLSNFFRK